VTVRREPAAFDLILRRLGPGVVAVGVALIVVHVLFLIAVRAFGSVTASTLYEDHLALSPANLQHGRVWTLATYALVHDLSDPFHLLFNVLVLGFFGPDRERRHGTAGLLRLMALAVVAGGVLQAAFAFAAGSGALVVGASAAMMALLAAFAWANPEARILLFFVAPVPARYLVPISVAIDFLVFLSTGAVAFFAHLGGIAAAWLLVRGWPPRITVARAKGWAAYLQRRSGRPSRRGFTVIEGGRKPDPRDPKGWN
jgi:membrane associated rhomboid family serine protease